MNLIEALRATADRIEAKPEQYRWMDCGQCNCGQLAQTVLGLGAENLKEVLFEEGVELASWRTMINEHPLELRCEETGLPLSKVFESLSSLGLRAVDFENLEFLDDKDVLEYMGIEFELEFDRPSDVISYMRAWACLLEEQSKSASV